MSIRNNVSIGRSSNNHNAGVITISIRGGVDEYIEVDMTLEDFALAVTGRAMAPCVIRQHNYPNKEQKQ